MIKHTMLCTVLMSVFLSSPLLAIDYRVEPLPEPAPADAVSKEIHALLNDHGARVIRGTKTVYCDVWLLRKLDVKPDFEPTAEIQYPFTPGQLLGVVRFARDGADFRDQDIEKGVYTMRFALQPVDGAHVGTSLTRDFILLVRAEEDSSPKPLDYDELTELSAEAAQSSHPCMLALKRPLASDEAKPSMRHDAQHDWWILSMEAQTSDKPLALDIVIRGIAEE